ncbi:Integral membrane protein [Tritrichomonas foetus]|uniref:Integral membrane protein n=1 Tax=Tritrichomonas foetus TaxID=1144522 RepID=A0A1J4JPC4_9EUKA|nr:Integral membrane protein [Tritrichomonas foetus]|eukprot:OHT00594.1 Integral membrane protein [Tritrichomonas foetus]
MGLGFGFAITGMLIFGTCTSVSMKIMLQIKAAGYAGIVHNFDQPFTQSILMFFGMMFSALVSKCWDPENKGQRPPSGWRQRVMVSIPSAFDLFASTLMTFGLIYINVSVFQMLRGSMVIFSVLFSIIFLRRKIKGYEWFGVALTVIALVMIGTAGIFIPPYGNDAESGEDGQGRTTGEKVMGSLLVIASQCVQAGQIVTEEFILSDVNLPALEVVGWEGIWGMLMMIFIAFPFALICPGDKPSPFGKSLENFMDSFIQLFTSGGIALTCGLFLIAVLFYNIFGMLVTSHSSAVFRTILEAARTLLIWVVMLICAAAGSPFGEVWCSWSWLELAGFIILVCSSFIYSGAWKLPFFTYPPPE